MDSVDGLRFSALERRFGRVAVLEGVAGGVGPGELLLVTGRNGCGKSTLLRCLAGLLAPDRGSIELCLGGRRLDIHERRRAVGYLAPDLSFYDELTVRENLELFARLRRVSAAPALALADELGLPLSRLAGVLSSGMRQRLRWAFLELAIPSLLLLDEPFQNLDEEATTALGARLDQRLAAGALAVVATPSSLPLPLPRIRDELRLDR
ncbi:MAG: ATP-binding cassette domain-containing protein [Thermoanaerobaculia bacterium]